MNWNWSWTTWHQSAQNLETQFTSRSCSTKRTASAKQQHEISRESEQQEGHGCQENGKMANDNKKKEGLQERFVSFVCWSANNKGCGGQCFFVIDMEWIAPRAGHERTTTTRTTAETERRPERFAAARTGADGAAATAAELLEKSRKRWGSWDTFRLIHHHRIIKRRERLTVW